MNRIWADEQVSCVHPGWPILVGRQAVLDSAMKDGCCASRSSCRGVRGVELVPPHRRRLAYDPPHASPIALQDDVPEPGSQRLN
jgi:hypothetical protein